MHDYVTQTAPAHDHSLVASVEHAGEQIAGVQVGARQLRARVQILHWPNDLLAAVADRGFAVARFDNRDTGLSTQFSTVGVPNLFTRLTRPTAAAGYRSEDIADDGIRVLEALRWDSAHVVGQRTDMQVDPSLSTPRDWRTERLGGR